MNDLGARLERLGLHQYLQRFASEGFDTWATVLDITESDLTALGVKLGHRRKLQRAIAEARGQHSERALVLEHGRVSVADTGYQSDESTVDTKESSGHMTPAPQQTQTTAAGTKRKYRRHPKTLKQADEHAPERPPSAYVIFSNQIREEIKGKDLSFTEIAKLVGERWQVLDPSVREMYEKQAASAKEKYYAQMAEYKKTSQYQDYQQYLANFKAKHATPRNEGKRSKIHPDNDYGALSRSVSQEKRFGPGSHFESSSGGHNRTHSNPGGTGLVPGYVPPSASTSPAQFSAGLQSPSTQQAYSPRSSPPPSASVYGSSYDLPHHARTSGSAADSRISEYSPPGPSPQHWQHSHSEEHGPSHLNSELPNRRPVRPSISLPPLVHQDTSYSSHSDLLPTPPIPYQMPHLPPLDPSKADRQLPQPLPPMTAPRIVASPAQSTPMVTAHSPGPQLPAQAPQFQALLRASELARETDLQDEASKWRDLS